MTETFKNFIAGEWVAPSTGEYFENRNPADWNDVIGLFPRSGPADLKRAVDHAVQLSAGEPYVEDVPGAALRERGDLQARGGRSANGAFAGRGPAGSRASA